VFAPPGRKCPGWRPKPRNNLASTTCLHGPRWGRTSGICAPAVRCLFSARLIFWLRLSGLAGAIGFTRRCHSDGASAWDLDPLGAGIPDVVRDRKRPI